MASISRPLSDRPLDLFLTAFFIVHIPTSLLIDGQAILPKYLTWGPARSALDWFVGFSSDPFMGPIGRGPIPCHGLINDSPKIRVPSIFYCGHVMTTLVPILSELCLSETLTLAQKQTLIGIYLPYFAIPAVLLYRMTLGFEKWRLPGAKRPDSKDQ
ncbi:hypothetical protein SmJEL517_g02688 [Synchytrium microbalum]|uniref:EXPERA domain-containing protein n=1 Tax=Synchytrium microbalum TaxID=1806994 RepID=A0A507CAV0_9FUNG|nr:uncharacterized protein SmJEL517_g02688 [Synchytrium microbalum]TPX34653.1 hypothetical protein SmJEL517_g02688 [Synchytrium microbalum]